jgi:hypothetical protein
VLQIYIQVHSKDGEPDIVICKWQNYMAKDGLNARIIPMLPIERGLAGEFFFKSLSTTTFGITRKTIFALKIPCLKEAEEFHMWWLHFNGQIKAWWEAGDRGANERSDIFSDLPMKNVESIISINTEFFDRSEYEGSSNKTNKKKRKLVLVSPREVSGVGKQHFNFEKLTSPESRPSPAHASQPSEEPVPLPKDCRNPKDIVHDRLIFNAELTAQILSCLRKNNVSAEDYVFQTNDQQDSTDAYDRKSSARIAGVPQYLCGLLWSAADDAARTSQVPAVRAEQEYIDYSASCMTEEAVHSDVVTHCLSIPTIRICPIGMNQDLERLTFQRFCDEPVRRFCRHTVGKLASMPVGEGTEVHLDANNRLARSRRSSSPPISPTISRSPSGDVVVDTPDKEDEDEEVLVDDSAFAMSQKIDWL